MQIFNIIQHCSAYKNLYAKFNKSIASTTRDLRILVIISGRQRANKNLKYYTAVWDC